MEQENEPKPIKRYECQNCGIIVNIVLEEDINKQKCCGSPNFRLILFEDDGKAQQELAECYNNILRIYDYYMDIPSDFAKLNAIYDIGTYFHQYFNTYPYFFINAMRGSGKTRLLKINSHLCKGSNGEVQTGVTESVLFRAKKGDTLIIDECENIGSKDKAVFREYLNVCYKRGGVIKRNKKVKVNGQEEYKLEVFEPFKPIILANIYGLEEVLADRCITATLEKSGDLSKTKKQEDFENNPFFQNIKRTLEKISVVMSCRVDKGVYIKRWNQYIHSKYNTIDITTLTTQTTLNDITTLPLTEQIIIDEDFFKIDKSGLEGRNLELFFPLFQIAKMINEDTFLEILEIATRLNKDKKEEEFQESKDVSLYEFVTTKEHEGLNFLPLRVITSEFRTYLGDLDPEYDKWVNERWMGRALKRLNLLIKKKRTNKGRYLILNYGKAKEKLKIFKKEETKDD